MNKKYLISVIVFFAVSLSVFIVACFLSVKRVILNREQLSAETWLEVEKNETVKICIDSKVRLWETSLASEILNASCLKIQVPTLIGVYPIHVQFPDTDSAYKINLAVGMKYLDFKNEDVFFERDLRQKWEFWDKSIFISGTYLVDKYPVTNCEITQLLWDDIPLDSNDNWFERDWAQRKKIAVRNENCNKHDSAANSISLYQAMKYANIRSIREGLKPYYTFIFPKENLEEKNSMRYKIRKKKDLREFKSFYDFSGHKYFIGYYDFIKHEIESITVDIDTTSDGYRLPYYDEWVMLAHGGNKKIHSQWGYFDTFAESTKYAKLCIDIREISWDNLDFTEIFFIPFHFCRYGNESGPVGELKPNGYGLYDMFGLVEEHVVYEKHNMMRDEPGVLTDGPAMMNFSLVRCADNDVCPSCLKGGGVHSDWRYISYDYISPNYYDGRSGGFRLVRNIGNNAKWTEVKSK